MMDEDQASGTLIMKGAKGRVIKDQRAEIDCCNHEVHEGE